MIFKTILVKSTCTAPPHDHHHLRYIRKIEYCAAYHLCRAIILPAQSQALVHELMPWQEIPIGGLAEVETTEEVENGTRLSTTKLSATLCHRFQLPSTPTAFRLTDVQGRQYLVGTAQQPFPLVKQEESIGSNAASQTAFTMTIQHTSEISLVFV